MQIVLTGVSRGLGKALVEGFIAEGHTVVGCARSAERMDELKATYGEPHAFDALDVSDASAVESWAARVITEYGPPGILINNAALINRNATLWEVPVDEFSALMDTNLKGVFHVIRAFLPAMIDAGEGVVVNLSSGWGRSAASQVAPYCTTKWGIEGMTQSLAQELPPGLIAVPLNPGIIHTEMLDSCFGEAARGFPTPQDWATRAVPYILGFSATDNGRPVTVPGC